MRGRSETAKGTEGSSEVARTRGIPAKYRLVLAVLGLIGFGAVLFATNRYGAGLSPDSVGYVATARSMAAGTGIESHGGRPLVVQPPFYPAILAAIDLALGVDPLSSAHIVNALLFGLIVYLGGLLALKHLSSSRALALVGTLAIVFSSPLFRVATWAWSEPLFVLLVLLAVIFAHSYLAGGGVTSLALFSLSAALSCLTRYIGVTLILWGALAILLFHRRGFKRRLAHVSLFVFISALPVGLWLIRNYAVSSTLFGQRAGSASGLSENFALLFSSLLSWYVPGGIAGRSSILTVASAGVGIFAAFGLRDGWQGVKAGLRQTRPLILLVFVYLLFLAVSSSVAAYDPIDDRLLSPVYVPLTLFLLILLQALVDPYRRRFSKRLVDSFLAIGISVWLVFSIRSTVLSVADLNSNGQGYSGRVWKDSETVRYLVQHRALGSGSMLYSNGPDVSYILAHTRGQNEPRQNGIQLPGDGQLR